MGVIGLRQSTSVGSSAEQEGYFIIKGWSTKMHIQTQSETVTGIIKSLDQLLESWNEIIYNHKILSS